MLNISQITKHNSNINANTNYLLLALILKFIKFIIDSLTLEKSYSKQFFRMLNHEGKTIIFLSGFG